MMFRIRIADKVRSFIISELNKRVKVEAPMESAGAESAADNINDTLHNIFLALETNPYCYPQLTNGVRMAVEVYLPFILFYKIIADDVFIVDGKLKGELF